MCVCVCVVSLRQNNDLFPGLSQVSQVMGGASSWQFVRLSFIPNWLVIFYEHTNVLSLLDFVDYFCLCLKFISWNDPKINHVIISACKLKIIRFELNEPEAQAPIYTWWWHTFFPSLITTWTISNIMFWTSFSPIILEKRQKSAKQDDSQQNYLDRLKALNERRKMYFWF